MLMIVFFMFGTLFVDGIEGCLRDGVDACLREGEQIIASFGSVQKAMVSMFKALTGGEDWGVFYSAISPLGTAYAMLYLFFIAFCNFAFMNILTGIFMENAMNLAKPDRDMIAFERRKEEMHQVKELTDLF